MNCYNLKVTKNKNLIKNCHNCGNVPFKLLAQQQSQPGSNWSRYSQITHKYIDYANLMKHCQKAEEEVLLPTGMPQNYADFTTTSWHDKRGAAEGKWKCTALFDT